ncbi:MAG: hydroxyacylglutathione hydrolase [Actinomycetota bacterium]|nr:hydroxyacylglutathione hydrolase [Actinomycetota bacterium]
MTLRIFDHKVVGPLACNCYIVGDAVTKAAIVIDPGGDATDLVSSIQSRGLVITAIVATHAHFDHVVAAEELRRVTGAPFFLHALDRPLLDWMQESARMFLGIELDAPPDVDREVSEGDSLVAGDVELSVLHTPGHSPGSISLIADGAVFSGDTLFQGSVGRTDLPGGDHAALVTAVRNKLFTLDDDLAVYPGHGPATSLGDERRFNPFVGDAAR